MREATPPHPHTPSWRGAQLKNKDKFYFNEVNIYKFKNASVSWHHTIRACRHGSITSRHLIQVSGQLHTPAALSPEKQTPILNKRQGESQGRYGCGDKETNPCPCRESNPNGLARGHFTK
jgi:hypothetical protein